MYVFIALVVIAISIFLTVFLKRRRYFEKCLEAFPGPPNHFFFGCANAFLQEGLLRALCRYKKEYGDMVYARIGPNIHGLICTDLNFAKKVFSENFGKSSMFDHVKTWLGEGLLTTPGHKWKAQRKFLTPAFNTQMLNDFMPVYDKQSDILITKLQEICPSYSFNIYDLISLCTLDIICETSMGATVNAQENKNLDYVRSIKEILKILVEKTFVPWKSFKPIYIFTDDYKKEKRALKILSEYTNKVICERIKLRTEFKDKTEIEEKEDNKDEFNEKRKPALLDILLDCSETLTRDEIENEVNTFLFAGHDTATTAMTFFIFEIAKHPEIQDKLFEEQESIYGRDIERATTIQDIQEMRYLEMAIKESLRMYTPAVAFMRELENDLFYEGTFIPKGVVVILFLYGMHYSEKYFAQPEIFNPSRFEDQNAQAHKTFSAFGMNPRNCIGQKYAMHEMKVILGKLIRHFEFGCAVPEHKLDLKAEALLVSKSGVNVKVSRRR